MFSAQDLPIHMLSDEISTSVDSCTREDHRRASYAKTRHEFNNRLSTVGMGRSPGTQKMYLISSHITTNDLFFHQLVHYIFVPGVLLRKFLTAGPPYAKPGYWALSCSLPKSISGVPFFTPDPPVLRHGGQQHWAATCTRSELKHLQ